MPVTLRHTDYIQAFVCLTALAALLQQDRVPGIQFCEHVGRRLRVLVAGDDLLAGVGFRGAALVENAFADLPARARDDVKDYIVGNFGSDQGATPLLLRPVEGGGVEPRT